MIGRDDDNAAKRESITRGHRPHKFNFDAGRHRRGLFHEDVAFGTGADDTQMHFMSGQCRRIDQRADAFQLAQFADEYKIGGVARGLHWCKICFGHAIGNDCRKRGGFADFFDEGAQAEVGLKNESIREAAHQAFGVEKGKACQTARIKMQRPAMRRIDTQAARNARQQAGISPAFCAMSVDHIGARPHDAGRDPRHIGNVADTRQAVHFDGMNTEFAMCADGRETFGRYAVARYFAADNADLVSGLLLTLRQIADMAKQTAERRTKDMQNVKRLGCRAFRVTHQKYRSLTRIVSPGRTGAPAGKSSSTKRPPCFRVTWTVF